MSVAQFPRSRPSGLLSLIRNSQWAELASALRSGVPAHLVSDTGRTLLEEFLFAVHRSPELELSPDVLASPDELRTKRAIAAAQLDVVAAFMEGWHENDPEHPTPLTIATMMGRQDIVAALLKAGQDPNEVGDGETPATGIARRRMPARLTILEMREQPECDPDPRFFGQSQCLLLMQQAGLDLDKPDRNGASPLQLACLAKDNQAMMFFLTEGADPEGAPPSALATKNLYRLAPLEIAITTHNSFAVHALLQGGANPLRRPEVSVQLQHESEASMAELAGGMGTPAILEEFYQTLGSIDSEGLRRGWHFAALMDEVDNINWFLQRGMDIGSPVALWGLHAAAQHGRAGVVRRLHEAGMDFTAPNPSGASAWDILKNFQPALAQEMGAPFLDNVVPLRRRN